MPPRKEIESYQHTKAERLNNPPAGLVTAATDAEDTHKTFAYDPHIDPQLTWAGKAEHTSFEVPTVSLHVHERLDPRTIIESVRSDRTTEAEQLSLFEQPKENPSIRKAIEFYQHKHGWTNRLIAGDSLLIMNSLLEKEGMAGKVQMVYIDPPYGIKYGSNFQPFVSKRDVRDGKDDDMTAEPEQIRAFRDTWELGIHSYLTYLRDRLLLARDLLTESGSVFVQISDENVHHVRELMDEVFGAENYTCTVSYKTSGGASQKKAPKRVSDYIVWYAKNHLDAKFRRLYHERQLDVGIFGEVEDQGGLRRSMSREEKDAPNTMTPQLRPYTTLPVHSKSSGDRSPREFDGREWTIPTGSWRYSFSGFRRLATANRLVAKRTVVRTVSFFDDFPYEELTAVWIDTAPELTKLYAVQTALKPIQRCMLMTTDPGDLVFDPTCGSGTTAFVAEQWGRRWITCDTSRVAITLAKQRLMTANHAYYKLAQPQEGVGSGFDYKTVPHITLKSIANNPDIREGMSREEIEKAIAKHAPQETLYDQPNVDRKKTRVTGPFTVEAVPAPAVKSIEGILENEMEPADASLSRSGETLRQNEWRDELQRTGIRGKAGQHILLSRLEPLPGCRWLHADGETQSSDNGPQRIVVSFGPEHAPLEQRQVEMALEEAQTLIPKPKLVVFTAFQFDPEAAKDIDETNWPGVTLLKAQMNADLLTDDLKKKRSSNESFWLIGEPDVKLETIRKGQDKGKLQVTVQGFDYYNTKTGAIDSGGTEKIAVWLLDTDYDGRSVFPRQVFFPMAGPKDGWARLAKNLKAEIDEELIEAYRGTVSLPFKAGKHQRIAVKIVDDRGIESLKVMGVK